MQYKPLTHIDRIEKSIILANRIIVKALQSDRGDIIRVMNVADLKMMKESVFHAVHNILAVETLRAYEYKCDNSAEFKPRPDVEIEEEVSAFFEIDGKLQYREVMVAPFVVLHGIDESLECLTQQIEMGERGMRYNPYSLADRLEKAGIFADAEIMTALQDKRGESIRAMSYAKFKLLLQDVFSLYYYLIYAEAVVGFEKAFDKYDAERDGIENDPRKKFSPKTKFEVGQEIKAYFKEQGLLQ